MKDGYAIKTNKSKIIQQLYLVLNNILIQAILGNSSISTANDNFSFSEFWFWKTDRFRFIKKSDRFDCSARIHLWCRVISLTLFPTWTRNNKNNNNHHDNLLLKHGTSISVRMEKILHSYLLKGNILSLLK